MIPKKIHYCWFGRKEIPERERNFIEGWRRLLPDYEIIEWNESNYDVNRLLYVREAYRMGLYAFVSDVCRLEALYNDGGIYLDTDIELLKSFDPFLGLQSFTGTEYDGHIATGVIGSQPGEPWIREALDYYSGRHFLNHLGHPKKKPNPRIFTEDVLPKVPRGNLPKSFAPEFFTAKDYRSGEILATANTVAVHHFVASWRRRKTLAERIATLKKGLRVRYFTKN